MSQTEAREKCGVFGVYGKGLEAARNTFFGLFALQHRGQESAGIVTSDGYRLFHHKGMGLVNQVFREEDIQKLEGFSAIGHVRYSTNRESSIDHCQPVIDVDNSRVALAHNGNLPSTRELENFSDSKNIQTLDRNDSELMTDAISYYIRQGADVEEAIRESYPLFTGAFSLLVLTKEKLIALRDQCGIRPLSLGRINGGFAFASETCAFDTVGAEFVRDVQPGEMVVVTENGIRSEPLEQADPKLDIFEFVYFARPESILLGKRVNEVRRNFGRILAQENPLDLDLVIPIPDSGIPAALGYAEELGIKFDHGLIKNRYIHRTFIEPAQRFREKGVSLKFNAISEVLEGKKVVVVDDSIVRGTTCGPTIGLLRRAGAKEVHIMITSPPVRWPDFYGIDTPKQDGLIAAVKSVEEIREHIGADSLYYLPYDGMIRATGLPENVFSTSCFTGKYPIDIAERVRDLLVCV